MDYKFNAKINVVGEKLVYQGDCIARHNGLAVFVPNLIPGENAEIIITKKKKDFAQGIISRLIKPSPYRINPPCPRHFCPGTNERNACGGCVWQHIDYKHQLAWKKNIFKEVFAQMNNPVLNSVEINEAPKKWNFRHKIQIPVESRGGKTLSGFYKAGSHTIVDINSCLIQNEAGNKAFSVVKALLDEASRRKGSSNIKHILVRVNSTSTEGLICFVTGSGNLENAHRIKQVIANELPFIKGIFQNINPYDTNVILGRKTYKLSGSGFMEDSIGKIKYAVSVESFFQTNPSQAECLYNYVKELVSGGKVVFDLYSGSGGIGLYVASAVSRVYGIEENYEAVKDAARSVFMNKINNAYFIQGKVEEALFAAINKSGSGNNDITIIINPPRSGCSDSFLGMLLKIKPKNIIYVSCNPATLARDARILTTRYGISAAKIFDMFPHSYHMESVIKFCR